LIPSARILIDEATAILEALLKKFLPSNLASKHYQQLNGASSSRDVFNFKYLFGTILFRQLL